MHIVFEPQLLLSVIYLALVSNINSVQIFPLPHDRDNMSELNVTIATDLCKYAGRTLFAIFCNNFRKCSTELFKPERTLYIGKTDLKLIILWPSYKWTFIYKDQIN